jgi:hypothetical protein
MLEFEVNLERIDTSFIAYWETIRTATFYKLSIKPGSVCF